MATLVNIFLAFFSLKSLLLRSKVQNQHRQQIIAEIGKARLNKVNSTIVLIKTNISSKPQGLIICPPMSLPSLSVSPFVYRFVPQFTKPEGPVPDVPPVYDSSYEMDQLHLIL